MAGGFEEILGVTSGCGVLVPRGEVWSPQCDIDRFRGHKIIILSVLHLIRIPPLAWATTRNAFRALSPT